MLVGEELVFTVEADVATPTTAITLTEAGLKEREHLQEWVKEKGLRVIIVFEGRDAAGKGGTIKAIAERVSPRVFRVTALPTPSDRQKSQMFMQRYLERFPAAGGLPHKAVKQNVARPYFKAHHLAQSAARRQPDDASQAAKMKK